MLPGSANECFECCFENQWAVDEEDYFWALLFRGLTFHAKTMLFTTVLVIYFEVSVILFFLFNISLIASFLSKHFLCFIIV